MVSNLFTLNYTREEARSKYPGAMSVINRSILCKIYQKVSTQHHKKYIGTGKVASYLENVVNSLRGDDVA